MNGTDRHSQTQFSELEDCVSSVAIDYDGLVGLVEQEYGAAGRQPNALMGPTTQGRGRNVASGNQGLPLHVATGNILRNVINNQ